jgi:hypothetical protein
MSDTTYTFEPSALREGGTYYWKVRAWNNHGQMRYSDPPGGWSFHVLGDIAAPEPFSLLSPTNAESLVTTEPTLAWEVAQDSDPGDSVVYTLYWSEDSGFGSSEPVIVGEETSYTFEPSVLQPSSTYYWKVRARDSYGLMRWSSPPDGWSFYIKAPEQPDLQLEAEVSDSGILLTWIIPEQLEATSCTVYRRAAGSAAWEAVSTLGPGEDGMVEYLDADAEPGVSYEYEVEVHGPSGPHGRWGPVSAELPEVVLWFGVSPNPGRSPLTVEFGLPSPGNVVLRLYDAAGREVARRTLLGLRAGNHSIPWTLTDQDSRDPSSGVYWIRLDTAHGSLSARWTVIR